jgi:hypothetical protein
VKLFGIYVVRNEVDVVGVSISHHLAHGIDRILVIDNGSTDGTVELLQDLRKSGRVEWESDPGPFFSGQMYTRLAQQALAAGADWIAPIGADEFWYAESGDLKTVLSQSHKDVVEAPVVQFIQRRNQLEASPAGLLTMTRRIQNPVGPPRRFGPLLVSGALAYVELEHTTRVMFRASADATLTAGAHKLTSGSENAELTTSIRLLHASLRSRAGLTRKTEKGLRIKQAGYELDDSVHLRRWSEISGDKAIDVEWSANSYREEDGTLDVAGARIQTIFDPTLKTLAAPWIESGAEHVLATAQRTHDELQRALALIELQRVELENLHNSVVHLRGRRAVRIADGRLGGVVRFLRRNGRS